jgi:hypothetical protein
MMRPIGHAVDERAVLVIDTPFPLVRGQISFFPTCTQQITKMYDDFVTGVWELGKKEI